MRPPGFPSRALRRHGGQGSGSSAAPKKPHPIGWLGGPQDYIARHGHPRLRMRHARVPVDVAMRDAWIRAMTTALDEEGIEGDLRRFLDQRFAEVADFTRNQPG